VAMAVEGAGAAAAANIVIASGMSDRDGVGVRVRSMEHERQRRAGKARSNSTPSCLINRMCGHAVGRMWVCATVWRLVGMVRKTEPSRRHHSEDAPQGSTYHVARIGWSFVLSVVIGVDQRCEPDKCIDDVLLRQVRQQHEDVEPEVADGGGRGEFAARCCLEEAFEGDRARHVMCDGVVGGAAKYARSWRAVHAMGGGPAVHPRANECHRYVGDVQVVGDSDGLSESDVKVRELTGEWHPRGDALHNDLDDRLGVELPVYELGSLALHFTLAEVDVGGDVPEAWFAGERLRSNEEVDGGRR
jgi:hypothetical protein